MLKIIQKQTCVQIALCFLYSTSIIKTNQELAWQEAQKAWKEMQQAWNDWQKIETPPPSSQLLWRKALGNWQQAEQDWNQQPAPSPKPGPNPKPQPTPGPQPNPQPSSYPFINQKPFLPPWTGSYTPTPQPTPTDANPPQIPQEKYRTANTEWGGSATSNRWGAYSTVVPKPTNRWFVTSLIYNPTPDTTIYPLFAFPFVLNVTDTSLQINAPNINIPSPKLANLNSKILAGPPPSYVYGFPTPGDWEFSAVESLSSPVILPSSNPQNPNDNATLNQPLSIGFQWGQASKGFSAYIVRGMPYVTLVSVNVTPKFSLPQDFIALLSVNGNAIPGGANKAPVSVTGSQFTLQTNDGKIWYLFSMSAQGKPITITLNCYEEYVQASAPFSGVLRLTEQVTIFPQDTNGTTIKQYASCFPISGSIDFSVTQNYAQVFFNWKTLGTGPLLMMALPHHQKILNTTTNKLVPQANHQSLRGTMIGVAANPKKVGKTSTAQWVLNYSLPTTTWKCQKTALQATPTQIAAIKTALAKDKDIEPGKTDDVYGFGKEIAKLARLALIAQELNDSNTMSEILANMQTAFSPWIKGTCDDPLYYDVNPQNPLAKGDHAWGGICSKKGLSQSDQDFGQGWYNDHHFHYGYFIYAAAVFIHLSENKETTFITNKLIPFIYDLIRDIANPIADQYFPDYRMMDWYLGHSMAAGLFPFSSGKNQESTSEAVNAWYGIYLFGDAINQPSIKNLGAALMSTEILSAQTYWFLTPSNQKYASLPGYNIYPQAVLQANNQINPCVGVLWEGLIDFETFFSDGNNSHPVEYTNLIHYLPFTPITETLIPPLWNSFQYGLAPDSDYAPSGKATARTLMYALTDPNAAIQTFRKQNPTIWESWKGFIYMSLAISNPTLAWTTVRKTDPLTTYDNGNSETNTLWWIATRS